MTPSLLQKIAQIRSDAPATRRAILDLILEDPDRVLEESFEQLAERSRSSVPTIMRTCRDLGFAGLREFKLALAQELASRNITVNCVAPGFIRSAMTDVLPEAQKTALLGKIPAGDLGTGEDIAAAVVYLASKEAGYVTGQTLHVNGGMAMV